MLIPGLKRMESNPVHIRRATEADIPVISAIADAVWWEHYPSVITDAQIAYMLARGYAEDSLRIQLKDKGQVFFMGDLKGKAVAYVSYSLKTDGRQTWVYINKLYALVDSQGSGVGYALLQNIVTEARQRGLSKIRLNVNKKNPTVAWYYRQGFQILREEVLHIGFDMVMDDYVLELEVLS
jgi:diamine N-acetyltransferase